MPFRDQQRVPGKQWPVIEKGERALVLEDDLRLLLTGSDPAKQAIGPVRQRR
jgi:hypothetical protein